jgi:hypothetical protein
MLSVDAFRPSRSRVADIGSGPYVLRSRVRAVSSSVQDAVSRTVVDVCSHVSGGANLARVGSTSCDLRSTIQFSSRPTNPATKSTIVQCERDRNILITISRTIAQATETPVYFRREKTGAIPVDRTVGRGRDDRRRTGDRAALTVRAPDNGRPGAGRISRSRSDCARSVRPSGHRQTRTDRTRDRRRRHRCRTSMTDAPCSTSRYWFPVRATPRSAREPNG